MPMRSTIHAVCCGTNRTIVLAGSDGRWKYDGGAPPPGPPPTPGRPNMLPGDELDAEDDELCGKLVKVRRGAVGERAARAARAEGEAVRRARAMMPGAAERISAAAGAMARDGGGKGGEEELVCCREAVTFGGW